MAMTWALTDEHHDLTIRGGRLQVVAGAEEIRQRVVVTLRHYWREYFLNLPGGVPWYEVILGSKDLRLVELLLRREVLRVPGVVSIAAISVRYTAARHLSVLIDLEVEGSGELVNVSLQVLAEAGSVVFS